MIGVDLETYRSGLTALCQRLGVPSDQPDWSLISLKLAKHQPEFKKPKRGRPSLGPYKGGIDYDRALVVKALERAKKARQTAPNYHRCAHQGTQAGRTQVIQ